MFPIQSCTAPHNYKVNSSTGYQLLTEGLVFGGSTLTATDIVVAEDPSLGVGDPSKVSGNVLDVNTIRGAKATVKLLLEDVIDRA
jgi:hypothetical protein